MDVSGILQVVKESRLIYPDPEKEKRTTIGSRQAFEKLLKESHENPEKFWADVARDFVWFKPWKKRCAANCRILSFSPAELQTLA